MCFKQLPASNSLAGYPGSAGIPVSGRKQRIKTKMIHLKIGAWNVRMLIVLGQTDQRKRLGIYGIEIAALSETRFAEVGEFKEIGIGYTFFWSGVNLPSDQTLLETLRIAKRHQ